MRNYVFKLITDLEEWSFTPTAPFERKEFKINTQVSIVAGIISKKDGQVLVSFNDFIEKLIHLGSEPNDITGVSLALACCEITNTGDLGKVICEGLVIEKGKVMSRSGEKFNLVRGDSGYCHWRTAANKIEYHNLEYALSVILFSSVLYKHFSDTILMLLYKSFVFSESDLIKIKNKFDTIRKRVDSYRKRPAR